MPFKSKFEATMAGAVQTWAEKRCTLKEFEREFYMWTRGTRTGTEHFLKLRFQVKTKASKMRCECDVECDVEEKGNTALRPIINFNIVYNII